EVAAGDRVFEQIGWAAADEFTDLLDIERRQPVRRPHVVHTRRDGRVAVGERAVEVEEHRADNACVHGVLVLPLPAERRRKVKSLLHALAPVPSASSSLRVSSSSVRARRITSLTCFVGWRLALFYWEKPHACNFVRTSGPSSELRASGPLAATSPAV